MVLNKKVLGNKRKDYIDWDEFFMGISKLAAARSKDPSTQVGACIVDKENRILSIGYNGTPNGFSDDDFPWDKTSSDPNETKYPYVCHAELNAILNYRGNRKDFNNSKIYVDLFPCNECAKAIIQSGIKEIIYLSDKYNGTKENLASKHLFDTCGVKYRKLDLKHQKNLLVSLKPDEAVKITKEVY